MKQAESIRPDDAVIHDLYGQALVGTGNNGGCRPGVHDVTTLAPKQVQVMLRLAAAYQRKGDWPDSLDEYREASLIDASIDFRNKWMMLDDLAPRKEYDAAQERWDEHVAALKAAGKASEAAALETKLHTMQAAPSLSQQIDAALQAGAKADRERRFEDAAGNSGRRLSWPTKSSRTTNGWLSPSTAWATIP
jgi:hypothetical protein